MSELRTDIRVACIGCGTMGAAIMRAVMQTVDAAHVIVSGGKSQRAADFARSSGCLFAASNTEAVVGSDIIFLGVKPAIVSSVLTEISPVLNGKIVVSMAAGVSLSQLAVRDDTRYVRIMPNTPAIIGEGMIAMCGADGVDEKTLSEIASLLAPAGKVEIIPEKLIDCVGAISGSGPAYCFLFIEALADAAVMLGMPRKQAYIYAAQTAKGSAELVLRSGRHPGDLKDDVCSPGGTTIAAIKKLEEGGLRAAVMNAAQAAYDRTLALRKE